MAPQWFTNRIRETAENRTIRVSGADLNYLHWPNPGKPLLVFVHGHAAHAHWWDFIAPAFRQDYDIIAPDMSGSGDSEHRDQYSASGFAEEIIRCGEHAGHSSMTIVGHSFGGSMTRIVAHLFPESVDGIVLIDCAVPAQKGSRTPPPMPRTRERYYPDLYQGMRRFRLRPPQPAPADYILEHIAKHSLRETERGFQFKLDAAVFAKMKATESFPSAAEMVADLSMPVGFIYGGKSRFFFPEAISALEQLIKPPLLSRIDEAYHHVFLDQPEQFTDQLALILKRQLPATQL